MAKVPHSGNSCSGLCRPPCEHADCWQCREVLQQEADRKAALQLGMDKDQTEDMQEALAQKRAMEELRRLKAEAEKAQMEAEIKRLREENGIPERKRGGSVSVLPGSGGGGIMVSTVGGGGGGSGKVSVLKPQPVIGRVRSLGPQGRTGPTDGETVQITHAALAGLVDQIPGLVMDWNDGNPVFTRDGETLYSAAASTLPEVRSRQEQARLVNRLKAQGAKDEDIAAAVELLGRA